LNEYRKALDGMAVELKKVETLERKDFENLLILNGIKPKKIDDEATTSDEVGSSPEHLIQ